MIRLITSWNLVYGINIYLQELKQLKVVYVQSKGPSHHIPLYAPPLRHCVCCELTPAPSLVQSKALVGTAALIQFLTLHPL